MDLRKPRPRQLNARQRTLLVFSPRSRPPADGGYHKPSFWGAGTGSTFHGSPWGRRQLPHVGGSLGGNRGGPVGAILLSRPRRGSPGAVGGSPRLGKSPHRGDRFWLSLTAGGGVGPDPQPPAPRSFGEGNPQSRAGGALPYGPACPEAAWLLRGAETHGRAAPRSGSLEGTVPTSRVSGTPAGGPPGAGRGAGCCPHPRRAVRPARPR